MDPHAHEFGHGDRIDPHVVTAKGFAAPTSDLLSMTAVKVAVAAAAVFLLAQVVRWWRQAKPRNPFARDDRAPRPEGSGPELDQRKRDQVIKEGFHPDKVPRDLDAVIVGSGMGGLSAAAVLAKSGWKVLVLEQHDQAGGCCHTFIDKGFEFDVGVHYVGGMNRMTIGKFLLDQVSQGRIEWADMDDAYDVVSVGFDKDRRVFPVLKGEEKWKQLLKERFPKEHKAIDKFFAYVKQCNGDNQYHLLLKVLPLWLSKLLIRSGLIHLFTGQWKGEFAKPCLDFCRSLTSDKDLLTVMTYCWGDYGTTPSDSNFFIQALLNNHYMGGASYPVGGASEIAYNMIPVIERSGGKVLVRATVEEILHNGRKAMGVSVRKGQSTYRVEAPVVISAAGIKNTFGRLLPVAVAKKSYFSELAQQLQSGVPLISVFVGLNASNEELGLKSQNTWAFASNEAEDITKEYMAKTAEEVMDCDLPLLFISFPSAKDPQWSRHPGRESKSTCAIISMAKWEWYERFKDTELHRRGDEYEELKKSVGDRMIRQAIQLFPQIEEHIDYVDIGSPVTNNHYLHVRHGEVYGLDHNMERFSPWNVAHLRPKTDVDGLYLTGQDVLTCGVAGALWSGLLTAGAVLGRDVFSDLIKLYKANKKREKQEKKLD